MKSEKIIFLDSYMTQVGQPPAKFAALHGSVR